MEVLPKSNALITFNLACFHILCVCIHVTSVPRELSVAMQALEMESKPTAVYHRGFYRHTRAKMA